MFIKAMEYGPSANESTIKFPTWDQVEAALRGLDGQTTDSVILALDGQSYLGISGGEDNRFVLAGYIESFGSFICASGVHEGPAVDVVVAGDFNSYASKNVIELHQALEAARALHERGVLSEHLKWEKQS
jgi:hypothetical protein